MKRGRSLHAGGWSAAIAALLVVTACVERSQPLQLDAPPVRADGIVAFLNAAPAGAPNEYIVRAVTRRGVAVEDPGSFVAVVHGLGTRVSYVADASDAAALRVWSPAATEVRVAGAAADGLASGELFALRVRVARAADVNELRLELRELNDRSGASLRDALTLQSAVTWTLRP
jgi:hypothetical protein